MVIQYLENHVRQKVILARIIPQSRTVMHMIQVWRSLWQESSGQQHLIKQHGSSSMQDCIKCCVESLNMDLGQAQKWSQLMSSGTSQEWVWGGGGWLLSQFPPFRYFPNFSVSLKHTIPIKYSVYI